MYVRAPCLCRSLHGLDSLSVCPPSSLPTSDQSRASHSGGQLRLLQGSVRDGRRGLHAESSSTFSSVADSLRLHKTCRVRRPPLQLRLHSDHSPVHQLQAQRANKYQNPPAGGRRGVCSREESCFRKGKTKVELKVKKTKPEPRGSSRFSPRGARLSVARPPLLLGSVLLVAEVIVDDCTIGVLHAHHLLGLYT